MFLGTITTTAVRYQIRFSTIFRVLSLAIAACFAEDQLWAFDVTINKTANTRVSGHALPQPHMTNEFPYGAQLLGSGLYAGEFVSNSLGQKIPDGTGVLLLTRDGRRQERFSGLWNMGTPENGDYRFANGWRWYGDFSDIAAVGMLHAGENWKENITFEEAELRVRAVVPASPAVLLSPATTNVPNSFTVDVIVITDPGEVTVSFASTSQQQEQTSDADGNLQLSLPAGSYHLRCEKAGYQRKERDFSVGADGSRAAFCHIRLEEEYNSTSADRGEDAKRAVRAESFPFELGLYAPDIFAYLIRDRAQKIRSFLKSGPAVAKQPEVARVISGFWQKVAQNLVQGYQHDRIEALESKKQDGNRRFLEVALGAAAADYQTTKSPPANWGDEYEFPFPKSDGFKTDDLVTSTASATNFFWPAFPREVLDQSAAASILPRALKISLGDAADLPARAKDSPAWLRLVLVPDAPGVVRFQEGATNDQPWQPDAPFYMAATETSFDQMRLYARWAEQELARHPEQEKWFVRVPATKQLVGAQNLPYTGVTLDEALSFCNWLSFAHGREPAYTRSRDASWKQDRTKDGFRLADDSEWQFAARFGFDFLAAPGTPGWKSLREEFNRYELGGTNDLRLVYFFNQAAANQRAVDAPGVLLYPLGLRDLCGNAAELCRAETSTSELLRWTVCGGQSSFRSAGGVMPWFRKEFAENSNAEVGFRVVLPVPMDNF